MNIKRNGSNIRICFVCPGATSLFCPHVPLRLGGSEIQMYLIARELARRPGFDVHFIVHNEPAKDISAEGDISLHCMPFVAGWKAKIRFFRLLSHIHADIYLQQGCGSITKEIAFFCKIRRSRFVFWVGSDHDVDPNAKIQELDRSLWFEWAMLQAHLHIAQTQRQAELLRAGYKRESVLIRNAFPEQSLYTGPRTYILWVGRMAPVKRPELFIELAQRLSQEQFVLIGLYSGPMSHDVIKRCQPLLDRTPNLKYLPGVPFEEVAHYFNQAKLLVNTSKVEGYPNTFVQAAWAGTPLASLSFDPDGIIAERQLGIAPAPSLEAFSREIHQLIQDSSRWNSCSRNVRRLAEEQHDVKKVVDLLISALLPILDDKKRKFE